MAHFTLAEARDLVEQTLARCDVSASNAASVARALIAAEEAGQIGHGLRRLPSYGAQALSGKVDGHAAPVGREGRPGVLAVDACDGFAYPAIDLALDWLIAAAPRHGIVASGIHRSHHCGVAGVTVQRLADAGLVAMMFANTPAAMAPWGGNRALYGTDPIAFAAPRAPGEAPLVVDVSLSKVARGKIVAADQRGEAIPEGWALNADGEATTDPKAALAGTMVPMGDAKGTALALMVEILAAGLIGANFGYEASSFFTAEGEAPGVGQLIIAFSPGAFSDRALSRIADIAGEVESQPGARLPGARRAEVQARVIRDGLDVDAALLAEIDGLGRRPRDLAK
jgi:(2R)-3-sulfolactate dehydrogenase (NADP+)